MTGSHSARSGVIVSFDASSTPCRIRGDDGREYRLTTQGSSGIRKLRAGDRVDLEYAGKEWYAFPRRAKTEDRMKTMQDVFEGIEEAMFRGMGGGGSSADARARKDAEKAAKRKGEHTWKDEPAGGHGGAVRLYNKYGDVAAEVRWYDDDESRSKYAASVATPGVRGKPTKIGKYPTLEKAKAAAEKELGL